MTRTSVFDGEFWVLLKMNDNPKRHWRVVLLCLTMTSGCAKPADLSPEKAPLPVRVMRLTEGQPEISYSASGTAKSWKTEQIGFEVDGRVEWVLEPGRNIDGRVYDPDDNLIMKGTQLAQIEPERYEIAVQAARAELEVAQLNRDAIQVRSEDVLNAQLASAEADLNLAVQEFDRIDKLKDQNAASESEFQKADALVKTRRAAIRSLDASKKQAAAELKSATAQVERAKQALKDAERNLQDTKLYGSYQGQISEVSVVPGSVVKAGEPVLTLQMTNPIKVDVELSAQQSRKIRQRRSVPASFALLDENEPKRHTTAFVYNVDASADPTTRTFTMTLLLLNEIIRNEPSETIDNPTIARSKDLWPIRLNQMMGTEEGVVLVEEDSIRHDNQGDFIYAATNAKLREHVPTIITVRRQRLIKNSLRIPFLGNWIFRSITFTDENGNPIEIPSDTMYVGDLIDDKNQLAQWDGESVVLDGGGQWMLRPGDLVYVDLAESKSATGIYVPIEAIYRDQDGAWVFSVEGETVRRIGVEIAENEDLNAGAVLQVSSSELTVGMKIVVGGVHFLRDGQRVRVIHDETQDGSAGESTDEMPADINTARSEAK